LHEPLALVIPKRKNFDIGGVESIYCIVRCEYNRRASRQDLRPTLRDRRLMIKIRCVVLEIDRSTSAIILTSGMNGRGIFEALGVAAARRTGCS
jgi:hypothetical protein